MKPLLKIMLLTLPLVCLAHAQSLQLRVPAKSILVVTVIQDNPTGSSADIKGAFPASLSKSLDSKKLKEGDVVVCQTVTALHSGNGLMIPSGAKIVGHVTQATARSKGNPDSTLGITFDKIEISKGKEIPMKGTLQAIAPSLGDREPNTGAASGGSLGGSGANSMGGASGGAGTTAPPAGDMGANMNMNRSKPLLNAQSQGALGLKGLELKDSVISSSGKEVKLDSGTQMLINADIVMPTR